jgi:hypothetical protein
VGSIINTKFDLFLLLINTAQKLLHSTRNCYAAQETVTHHRKLLHSTRNCYAAQKTVTQHRELFHSTRNCYAAQETVPQHKKLFQNHSKNVSQQETVPEHKKPLHSSKAVPQHLLSGRQFCIFAVLGIQIRSKLNKIN